MFCSQKKSVHRLRVEQALSLVLTSPVPFGADVLAGLGCAVLCWSCPALAQAVREELCETWEKQEFLGLFAWILSLISARAPRACPSHDSCARQCPLWPRSWPLGCSHCLALGSSSWPGLASWPLWPPHPDLAMPPWASDPSLWPCVAVSAFGWLSPDLPNSSSLVLHCMLARALPLPVCSRLCLLL